MMSRVRSALVAIVVLSLALVMPRRLLAGTSYDQEIGALSEAVSAAIVKAQKKKVSVLDFTDLQGNGNELGRLFAEDTSVQLVMGNKGFSVVDRAHLRNILTEHKLTESGLVNPENAKKLGQFSGVDAIILGNATPLDDTIAVSVKIIATDTAEIVGAARARITRTKELEQLMDRAVSGEWQALAGPGGKQKEFSATSAVHKLPGFTAELISFQTLPDRKALATVRFSSTSKDTIALGVNQSSRTQPPIQAKIIDDAGNVTRCERLEGLIPLRLVAMGYSAYESIRSFSDRDWVKLMTEIGPGESLQCTLEFEPRDSQEDGRKPGSVYKLQMELIVMEGSTASAAPSAKLRNVYFDGIVPTPASGKAN